MKLRVALTLVLSFAGCRGGESESPPVHLIHNMDTQEKGKAYRKDTSGVFANGRLMQHPVEGTVALGQLDEDGLFELGIDPDPLTADGGHSGKPDYTFKFPQQVMLTDAGIDEAFVTHGKLRYDIYCTPCHGATGNGQGLIAQKAFDGGLRLEVPPRDLTGAAAKDLPIGKIYAAIKLGVNDGNMASYATQIPTVDRWAISAYVRRLQGVGFDGKPPEPPPAMDKVSVALGGFLYKNRGCNACHSLDGSKIIGPSWLGLAGRSEETNAGTITADDAYLKESMIDPKAKLVAGYGPVMPLPSPALNDIELDSLILFIKSLK